jgi:hypothetical protein
VTRPLNHRLAMSDLAEHSGTPINQVGRALGLIGRAAGEILGDGLWIDGPPRSMLALADMLSDDDLLHVGHSGDLTVSRVRHLQDVAKRLEPDS